VSVFVDWLGIANTRYLPLG